MDAEHIKDLSGTRYLPIERDGGVTLWVSKADVAVTWRGLAIVAAAVTCSVPLIFNLGAAPTSGSSVAAVLGTISVAFVLLRSSLRFARDVAGPAKSVFRRVRRSIELQPGGGEGRYRDGSAGAVIVDGDRFYLSELRELRVLITETVETERDITLRRTEFLPALVCERFTYELDRFAKEGAAQRFVEAFASACGRRDLIASPRPCPPWNPYRGTIGVGFVRVAELLFWTAGIVVAMLSWPRALAALAMGAGLVIDLVITNAEGRRMGAMRSALIGKAPDPPAVVGAAENAEAVGSADATAIVNQDAQREERPREPASVAEQPVPDLPKAAPQDTRQREAPVGRWLLGAIGAFTGDRGPALARRMRPGPRFRGPHR